VIVQLGDTEGVICADLSKSTLITKGTLTGVIDRLESKGLVTRESVGGDRRAIRARLTTTGQTLFKRVFPAHAEFLRPYFKNALSQEDIAIMKTALLRLRDSFEENKSPKDTSTKRPK
jgi:DNA-binding MarR family transcriptional regulator